MVSFVASGEARASFCIEAHPPSGAAVGRLLPALRELRRSAGLPVLYASDYIGEALRSALAEEGISYADSSGWVRVVSDDPLLLLTGQGAPRSPRAGRPRR